MLPVVRFEFDRSRVVDPSVRVRCIFGLADHTQGVLNMIEQELGCRVDSHAEEQVLEVYR